MMQALTEVTDLNLCLPSARLGYPLLEKTAERKETPNVVCTMGIHAASQQLIPIAHVYKQSKSKTPST